MDEVEDAVISSASVQVLPGAQGYSTVLVEGYHFVEGRVIFDMVCKFRRGVIFGGVSVLGANEIGFPSHLLKVSKHSAIFPTYP